MLKPLLSAPLVLLCLRGAAQVAGCTDPQALNYNATATVNNGSCQYAAAVVSVLSSVALAATVQETSGLLKWDNRLWTHNDNTDINLYALDTATAAVLQTMPLPGVTNTDWEDLAQDSSFIYIGDFGNNANGNRTNLQILRLNKSGIPGGTFHTDTIRFAYEDQTSFAATGPNNTNFDCEAFVVSTDSIYLFTKQWISQQTRVYALPKTPGTYTASPRAALPVQGLITGATYLAQKRLIALCGYSQTVQPFLYLLYDFAGTDFASGNKRKIDIALPFHQAEAIATTNGTDYFLTNEYFTQPPFITTSQKLHRLNLSPFLNHYLNPTQVSAPETVTEAPVTVYPNPAHDRLHIAVPESFAGSDYQLTNQLGAQVQRGRIPETGSSISVAQLPAGIYFLHLNAGTRQFIKVLKD